MDFKSDKAIYHQIADYVCERILQNDWAVGERIPSVREMGGNLAVNPNTVMRSYELLERNNIIFNQRGIGFSVAENAKEKILLLFKNEFLEEEVPVFFKKMQLLGLTFKDIERYEQK
ncbi:MAG: GntR family transcriptional regulator [Bacteroidales bacterium]